MNSLARLFGNFTIGQHYQGLTVGRILLRTKTKIVEKPKPGCGKQYRRIVHFEDEYTIRPLKTTHLAGRDPVTGRVIAKGIGGGIKHKYHWIKWQRDGPAEGPPQEEKVMEILDDGCRTAKIALVGVADELKYILATENMKVGDIIKTSKFIPRIPSKYSYILFFLSIPLNFYRYVV